jgi:hypothetical protein
VYSRRSLRADSEPGAIGSAPSPFIKLCGLVNISTRATRPPPARTSGRIPSEPRLEQIVRVGVPAYTRSSSSSLFSFLSARRVKSSPNNPLPPRLPTQDQMRTCSDPIPSRCHRPFFPSLTFSFHLSLFALGHRQPTQRPPRGNRSSPFYV